MKKFLCLFLLMFIAFNAHASTKTGLRESALEEMMDYAQKLYNRHDYKESARVFRHILAYDPQNAKASAYLNKMYSSTNTRLLIIAAPKTQPVLTYAPPQSHKVLVHALVQPQAVPVISEPVFEGPNADLKEEIANQTRALQELKEEIRQMRMHISQGQS